MTFQSGAFPATVQHITIAGAGYITIGPGAVMDLPRLEQLTIKSLSNLHIQPNGLRLHSNNKLRELWIAEVTSVTIQESAFSGTWESDTLVRMEDIQVLTVEPNGLNHQSHSLGPRLELIGVKLLNMSPASIVAPISRLLMSRVSMAECRPNSIGGDVARLVLNNTSINTARTGCVRAGGDSMETLLIVSCSLVSVQEQAFSGRIRDVVISNTRMTSIDQNGFQIQVYKVEVNDTNIDTLNSRGLNVSAKTSILFHNVRVRSLKRHASVGSSC